VRENIICMSHSEEIILFFNRFWLYIKLFVIMSITWRVELRTSLIWNSHESYLISDVIKCYSAGLAAFLLIWTPRVHTLVFEKYNTMRDDDDAENNANEED
jgi:hypothetical protein